MPVRRHVVGPPDQVNIGARPGDPEDLPKPGKGIVLAGGRLRLDLRAAVHSDAPSGSGRAALRLDRRFSCLPEISARARRACSALAARVPGGVLSLATEVTSVESGGKAAARVATTAGELDADLVVAADGIGSASRSALFPGHPGLRYAGFTTWRLLTGPVTGQVPMAESWGRGTVFGVMPLSDGRVYCYAAAPADPGARAGDELPELVRLFGKWHEPIPGLLAITRPQDVLRHDVAELAAPLPRSSRHPARWAARRCCPKTSTTGRTMPASGSPTRSAEESSPA